MIRIIRTKNGQKVHFTLLQIILLLVIMLLLLKKILINEPATQHKFSVREDDILKSVNIQLTTESF